MAEPSRLNGGFFGPWAGFPNYGGCVDLFCSLKGGLLLCFFRIKHSFCGSAGQVVGGLLSGELNFASDPALGPDVRRAVGAEAEAENLGVFAVVVAVVAGLDGGDLGVVER